MKLLNRLLSRRVCPRPASPPVAPPVEPAPLELDQLLDDWLSRVLGHLQPCERRRLTQRVANNLHFGDAAEAALVNALLGDGGQQHGQWAMLQIELGGIEEVEWQARELALAAGIQELYGWDWHQNRHRPARAALLELQAWLGRFGFALLQLETGEQEYCMLLAASGEVDAAVQAGARLGVRLAPLQGASGPVDRP